MKIRVKPGEWIPDVQGTDCCEEMKQAWEGHFIGVGDYDYQPTTQRDCEVNIYRCSPYPEGAVWESMSIRYCPWCKESITVDATEMPE